jgi:SpoVK/Ycf46/Vps4 family AAA+-type ATPase
MPAVVEKVRVSLPPPKNIRGLIELVEKNEISDHIEYNIDLRAIGKIKQELYELDNMIGMEKIKQNVFEQLIYFVQELHINDVGGDFKHTVIMGPPGTGKTRVAKIIGRMYSNLGVLKKNIFRKVTRSDLIAGYLGQTAIKTKSVVEECLGGVLFIDEAYSLSCEDNEDIFSKECLDTLCEALSDHKDDLMVIIAGYEDDLKSCFFQKNSGLESRFIWRFKMEPYSPSELLRIFKSLVIEQGWEVESDKKINDRWFQDKKEHFNGMGRDVEALITYIKIAHGVRIYGKEKHLRKKISLEDMDNGFKTLLENKNKQREPNFMNTIYI